MKNLELTTAKVELEGVLKLKEHELS
jgi:hypothetical protein